MRACARARDSKALKSIWIYLKSDVCGLDVLLMIIIIIIIIIINCNWFVTRWQWLFYMQTKYEIGYY